MPTLPMTSRGSATRWPGFRQLGHVRAKMKVGALPLGDDLRRVEVATEVMGTGHLAIDAMNAYHGGDAVIAAERLKPFGPMWFEDVCDPLDFETHCKVAAIYPGPIAAGEALFSETEAALLARHGGLRPGLDILVFDPVHCYGLPGFLKIVAGMERAGWRRAAFWPHGGHLFGLHVVAGLQLGGAELNPSAFTPFNGLPPGLDVSDGRIALPDLPGIGFEAVPGLADLFSGLLA